MRPRDVDVLIAGGGLAAQRTCATLRRLGYDGRVRLLTRKGNDFSHRFPQIVAALTVLSVRSCLIDGEAVVCNESGLAVFATDATGQPLGGRPRASEDQPCLNWAPACRIQRRGRNS